MAARHLTPVPDVEIYDFGRAPETSAERVKRLQLEARMLAREQVEAVVRDMNALAAKIQEIADGGEAYPAGVREQASRIASDLPQKAQGLVAILERTPL